MITFTWKDIELNCHHNMYGKQEVAFAGKATLVATDANNLTKEKQLSFVLGEPPESGFIESANLTKDQVVTWIETSLGSRLDQEKNNLTLELTVFKTIKFD